MGQKNNPQFAVGALWLHKPISDLGLYVNGVSVWEIIQKQSQGYRILRKKEQLTAPGFGEGLDKNVQCNYLQYGSQWHYIKNLDAVRTLYAEI